MIDDLQERRNDHKLIRMEGKMDEILGMLKGDGLNDKGLLWRVRKLEDWQLKVSILCLSFIAVLKVIEVILTNFFRRS